MDRCEQLAGIINEFSRTHDRGILERMHSLGDVGECIVSGLYGSATLADWKRFDSYVIAALRQPDQAMTSILCDVLDRRDSHVPANVTDDIVDLLHDIGDPAAISSLERAMLNPPEWDEFYHFARKSMWALLKIGTPEAINAVHKATQSDIPDIREEAQRKLGTGKGEPHRE